MNAEEADDAIDCIGIVEGIVFLRMLLGISGLNKKKIKLSMKK